MRTCLVTTVSENLLEYTEVATMNHILLFNNMRLNELQCVCRAPIGDQIKKSQCCFQCSMWTCVDEDCSINLISSANVQDKVN